MSFVGPSGSGKSTLLNMIGCLDHPTSGILKVSNQDVGKLSHYHATRVRGGEYWFCILVYTGDTNLELRFKLNFLSGDKFVEFGEKQNDRKMELRARYYF